MSKGNYSILQVLFKCCTVLTTTM